MHIDQIRLGDLTPEQFLRDYWQKRPLLIRQAIPDFESPITPDELAGLACETGVESRLILERDGKTPWEVRHGPFPERVFAELPETHWTLLVQEVNRHVPEIADLMDRFNFVPAWRVDDLMISYAAPEGSVGPHLDSYDVFLLQAYGQRRWQISNDCGDFVPDLALRILQQFTPEQTWVLAAGDMLYLPPNIAHHGVAVDECMTFSIGFLAPSHRELVGDYVQLVTDQQFDEQARYADPDLTLPEQVGEITPDALAKIREVIRQLPLTDTAIDQWFGRFITESRAGNSYERPEVPYTLETWWQDFADYGFLRRAARAAYITQAQGALLFIEGQLFELTADLAFAAPLLTGQRDFSHEAYGDQFPPALAELLCDWCNRGWFYFYDE